MADIYSGGKLSHP